MVTFHPETIARAMGVAVIFLLAACISMRVLAGVTGYDTMHGLVRFFELDAEMNLPTWYSSATLFASAILLFAIGTAERGRSRWTRHWFGLSWIFLALSIDEVGSFHEMFTAPTRALIGFAGFLYYAWVVPAAAVLLVVMSAYFSWFFDLPARTRKLMALAGILFIGGAIGLEMVGGLQASRGEVLSWRYVATATIEETFEMCGVLVWIYSVLDYARSRVSELQLRFAAPAGQAASAQIV